MIEAPQNFITRQECDKLAHQNGFRRELDEEGGWRRYASTTAQGHIWIAHSGNGDWLLATDHLGVKNEVDHPQDDITGPGIARYRFGSLTELYAFLPRVYALGISLPDAPLQDFISQTKNLPKNTEAERLVVQRVGQNIFRDRLLDYWQGRCPLTGITDKPLLRASHIKPWSYCESDAERLDVHNGLLLSALWDAAFDQGLVTFDNSGKPVFSSQISETGRAELRWTKPVSLTDAHQKKMEWHREYVFKNTEGS